MANLLEAIEIQTGKQPEASVIWMHGLGADGNDFVPIVNEVACNSAVMLLSGVLIFSLF